MHQTAIRRLDRAALALLQSLDQYSEELKPYLETGHLEKMKQETINLRRALLGLQMGALYEDWEVPEELLHSVLSAEALPVEEAAARVAEIRKKNQGPAKESRI